MASSYPAQIDSTITLPLVVNHSTPVIASTVNDIRDTAVIIESELGVKPSGTYGTVRARLDAIEAFMTANVVIIGGDLVGSNTQTVIGLQHRPVASTAPTTGQALAWDGVHWTPTTISGGGGGTPGGISGDVQINNSGTSFSGISPGTDGYVLQSNGTNWISDFLAAIDVTYSDGVSPVFGQTNVQGALDTLKGRAAPGGTTNDIQINISSAFSTDTGNFTYDPTLHSFAAGEGNVVAGDHSGAIGQGHSISGNKSTAVGSGCTVSDDFSFAGGAGSQATATHAFAYGNLCVASGAKSCAIGNGCTASANQSAAFGQSSTAAGISSFATGDTCQANGDQSVAMGLSCTASGVASVAMGDSCTASGTRSVALGISNTASGTHSLALGQFCTASGLVGFAWGDTCSVGVNGTVAIALGESASATRVGEFAHSSQGNLGYEGLHAIDLAVHANATPENLVQGDTAELTLDDLKVYSMRVRLVASKVGSDGYAHEVHEILLVTNGTINIGEDDIITNSTVNFASKGWSVVISNPSGLTLRFHCDPGADDVKFMARVEWAAMPGS